MELRHLRYFLAVAEEGQFTRAAERLAMQQPPLSQQIRLLEEELGFDLFDRQRRGVTLTPAGGAFAEDVARMLEALRQAIGNARRIAQGELGTISIGMTSSAGFHPFTSDQIRAFRAVCPDVDVELAELNAAEIIERLTAGQLHAAFLRKPVDTPERVAFEPLLDEPMVAVLPTTHPALRAAARAKPRKPYAIALRALRDDPFILVRRPGAPGMYADILAACQESGFAPAVVREVPRMLSAINLVATGFGVTLVPASMQRYGHAGVTYCAIKESALLNAPLHIAYARSLANSAALRFIQFVKETRWEGEANKAE